MVRGCMRLVVVATTVVRRDDAAKPVVLTGIVGCSFVVARLLRNIALL